MMQTTRFSKDDAGRAVTSIRNFGRHVGQDGILPTGVWTFVVVAGTPAVWDRRFWRLSWAGCHPAPLTTSSMDFSKLHILRELANGFLESVQRRTSVRRPDSTTSGPNRATRAETLPSGIVVRSWRPNVRRAPRPAPY